MAATKPRRQSWNKSQSDSYPVKQAGVAISIGLPLVVVGILFVVILIMSIVEAGTKLWLIGAGVLLLGLIASLSRRVI